MATGTPTDETALAVTGSTRQALDVAGAQKCNAAHNCGCDNTSTGVYCQGGRKIPGFRNNCLKSTN